ncbi:carbonic anhydrase [Phenylobacterium sp.]|uniref:carbonic anhydrase n=1 Tax=Phenylobacterium sp. TaxID=1871053 RepID=UPI002FE2BDB7
MQDQSRTGLSRRGLILAAGAGVLAAPAAFAAQPGKAKPAAGHAAPALTPEAAMARLMAGNARYVAARATHPNGDAARRRLVAAGQHPFAVVLACADSRVAPELIFDQGLGDLFVVRVAGNVVDDAVLASIEYAVIHLGANLVMALGHERCGAVKATADALDGHPSPDDADTKIGALAALIAPAVRAVPAGVVDKVDAAVSLNAAHAAAEIFAGSKPLRGRVLAGSLKIVAARYDLDDGRVSPAKGREIA